MNSSAGHGEGADGDDAAHHAEVLAIIGRIAAAGEAHDVLALFGDAVPALGAESGTFLSFIRDDALLSSYRCLHVGDPGWGAEYARGESFADDPWLEYAMHESEPVRVCDLQVKSTRQQVFVDTAARFGYANALIVPSPSPQGQARVGMLCLGSSSDRAFDGDTFPTVRLLARTLAMELHGWMRRSIRAELMRRSNVTEDDLELLRHELVGHSSKVIAAALNTEAKTIDCRFQRVSAKLGAANRRAAVRIAKLYGLL